MGRLRANKNVCQDPIPNKIYWTYIAHLSEIPRQTTVNSLERKRTVRIVPEHAIRLKQTYKSRAGFINYTVVSKVSISMIVSPLMDRRNQTPYYAIFREQPKSVSVQLYLRHSTLEAILVTSLHLQQPFLY